MINTVFDLTNSQNFECDFFSVLIESGKLSKITGKNIKKKAKDIINAIEKSGINIKEIDMVDERLENVFLRLTKGKK